MTKKQLLILSSLLLLAGLFGWQNVIQLRAEEPRRAVVTLEMMLTGEWIVPHLNGWSYYNKPPVFNWLMAVFFWITGSTQEWVVRLPSLISFVVNAFLIYYFTKARINKNAAILGGFFYITCAEVLLYGSVNTGEIDPFYSLLVFLQAFSIFVFFEKKKWWHLFLWSYALTALGFLTKGIPSLAFQALTILGWAIYRRNYKMLFHPAHFAGIGLLLAMCGGYFYLYGLQDDTFGFLVRQFKEAAQRTGLETETSETIIQSLTFPLQMAKLLLPWSLLVVFVFRKFRWHLKQYPLIAFSLVFVAINIPIYWFAGDFKPRYYFMFLSFLSIVLAHFYWENAPQMPRLRRIVETVLGVVAIVVAVGMLGLFLYPQVMELPFATARIITMFALLSLAAFVYWRSRHKIFAMILVMAMVRLALNFFYLPAYQADESLAYYRSTVDEMLEMTHGERIYLYGDPYTFSSDASIGPYTITKSELTTAPIIGYRIPYYITRGNKKVMTFDTELKPGRYYLAPESSVDTSKYEVLHSIYEHGQRTTYLLIRT